MTLAVSIRPSPCGHIDVAVLRVRSDPTAEDWLAAIRDRSRLGIAMAAMIRMIATTISNSISENPLESSFIGSAFLHYFDPVTPLVYSTFPAIRDFWKFLP